MISAHTISKSGFEPAFAMAASHSRAATAGLLAAAACDASVQGFSGASLTMPFSRV